MNNSVQLLFVSFNTILYCGVRLRGLDYVFLLILFSLVFSAAQREAIKKDFYQFFDGVLSTSFVPHMERDFEGQIRSHLSSNNAHALLQTLPFEPDNLNTGDCLFHTSCNVALLDELIKNPAEMDTVLHPATITKVNLLVRIAVFTYIKHSERFFGNVFLPVLNHFYTLENRLPEVTGGTGAKTKEQKTFEEWSLKADNVAFYQYKTDTVNAMANYLQFAQITITPNPLARSFTVVYGHAVTQSGLILMDQVKTLTTRFIKMSRTFGTLDTTGVEAGQIEILRQLANVTTGTPDVCDTFNVQYARSAGPGSPIIQSVVSGPTGIVADQNPTFVFQYVPSVPISHKIQKARLLVDERSEPHAVTGSEAVVLVRHVWWSGDRGLTPTTILPITYTDMGHVQNSGLNGQSFTINL